MQSRPCTHTHTQGVSRTQKTKLISCDARRLGLAQWHGADMAWWMKARSLPIQVKHSVPSVPGVSGCMSPIPSLFVQVVGAVGRLAPTHTIVATMDTIHNLPPRRRPWAARRRAQSTMDNSARAHCWKKALHALQRHQGLCMYAPQHSRMSPCATRAGRVHVPQATCLAPLRIVPRFLAASKHPHHKQRAHAQSGDSLSGGGGDETASAAAKSLSSLDQLLGETASAASNSLSSLDQLLGETAGTVNTGGCKPFSPSIRCCGRLAQCNPIPPTACVWYRSRRG